MSTDIYQFDRTLLEEGSVHVRKKSGDTSYFAHRHEYFEIILYQNCRGRCIINGSAYPMTDSCIFLLTPTDYHKIETQNTSVASSVIISFSESFIDAELRARLAHSARVWYSPTERTVRAMEELHQDYEGNTKNRKKKLFHTLNAALCDILEYSTPLTAQNPYISPPIAKAITLILSDISKCHKMETLSRLCGFSPAYFSSTFHKEMGKSFTSWLTDVRIEYAKKQLRETDLPLIDISYQCGYNTPSQFIKMFKKKEGIPPSKYRKESPR